MALGHKSKWLLMGIITVLMLAILLALAEGAVRLRQWFKYGSATDLNEIYAYDEELDLRVLIPNSETRTIKINGLGFRSPELKQPKPTDTLRFAFIGASTTYCAEVSSNEMTWPHLVMDQLQETYPDLNMDYINGGVPGYAIEHSRQNLNLKIKQLQPDVVIIYHATNDLSGETRALALQQSLVDESTTTQRSWLASRSLLWRLVEKNLRIQQAQRQVTETTTKLEFDPQHLGTAFREDLTGLLHQAQAIAPVVAVATFAYRIRAEQSPEQQLHAAASALYYMPFMTPQKLLAGYQRYNAIIREVAASTGAILIENELDIPGDEQHFNDSVHFKDAGSRLMAKRVANALHASGQLLRFKTAYK